jgi:hypothetical protein
MGFFDEVRVPPPPPPPSYRLPDWLAPPENIAPGRLYIDLMIAESPSVSLSVVLLKAYSAGLSFDLVCRGETGDNPSGPFPGMPFFGGRPLIDGGLGFGLQFADGRAAIANRPPFERPLLARPQAPVLRPVSGGSGGGRESRTSLWLWPLPPPGPLAFVCEWQLKGIAETRTSIDGADVVAAAAKARELWPDDRDPPPTENDVVI